MRIVVGLGNSDGKYGNTRHNVGFSVIDALAYKLQVKRFTKQNKFEAEVSQVRELLLVKPQTYMNKSGKAVQKILNFYKVSLNDLWVVHDDLDIHFGEYKIQLGKGPKVHNGIASIDHHLGLKDYWRVRIGIENREYKISGEEYVLGRFNKTERETLESLMRKVTDELVSRCL